MNQIINPAHNRHLGQLFSRSVLAELGKTGFCPRIRPLLERTGFAAFLDAAKSVADFFDVLYTYLRKNYVNEYIFKNEITNKLLLGRHSLNSSVLLNEFRVGTSKVDMAIVNGSATAYEIKTEYDSLARLPDQMRDYLKFFDKVFVVAAGRHIDKVTKIVDERVGVLRYTGRHTLSLVKNAESNAKNISQIDVLNSLRQKEYIWILEKTLGEKIDLPNTRLYSYAKSRIVEIQPEILHKMVLKVLMRRGVADRLKRLLNDIPRSMKFLFLSSSLPAKRMSNVVEALNQPIDYYIGN